MPGDRQCGGEQRLLINGTYLEEGEFDGSQTLINVRYGKMALRGQIRRPEGPAPGRGTIGDAWFPYVGTRDCYIRGNVTRRSGYRGRNSCAELLWREG